MNNEEPVPMERISNEHNNFDIEKLLPTPREIEVGADSVLYLRVLAFGGSRSLPAGVVE